MKGKVLLLLAIVLAFSASVFAQRTTVTDVLQLPSSNGKKVSSIMTDTTLTGATDAMLVSALAVKKYVDSRSGGSITQPVIYSVGLGSPLPTQPVPAGSAAIQIIDVNGNKALHLSNGVSWVSVGELLGVKNVDSLNITPGEIKLVHIGRNGAATGQVLKWNGTAWVPSSDATAPTGAAGGDLDSNYPNPTVVAIQGHPLSDAVPLPGQTLIWDGGSWNPTAPPGAAHEYADPGCLAPTVVPDPIVGPFLAWNTDCLEQWRWNGLEWVIDGSPAGTFYTTSQFAGNGEPGTPLALAQNGASTGQVMKWNGTVWAPGTDATGGGGVVVPGKRIPYGTGLTLSSEAAFTYDTAQNRLNVDTLSAIRVTAQIWDKGLQGATYNVAAYGILPNGADITANLQKLLDTIYVHGGGKITFNAGTYRINGKVKPRVNYNGLNAPNSPDIVFEGASSFNSGNYLSPVGGTILDCRYNGDTIGVFQFRSTGKTEFSRITFIKGATGLEGTPFIHTTFRTLHIHDCAFIGFSATSRCAGIILGGDVAYEGVSPADTSFYNGFQGYGTVIENNFFNFINTGVRFKTYANAVVVTNNNFWNGCGGLAAITITPAAANCYGNVISNNLIEMSAYSYGILLGRANGNSIIHNNFFDPVPGTSKANVRALQLTNNMVVSGGVGGTIDDLYDPFQSIRYIPWVPGDTAIVPNYELHKAGNKVLMESVSERVFSGTDEAYMTIKTTTPYGQQLKIDKSGVTSILASFLDYSGNTKEWTFPVTSSGTGRLTSEGNLRIFAKTGGEVYIGDAANQNHLFLSGTLYGGLTSTTTPFKVGQSDKIVWGDTSNPLSGDAAGLTSTSINILRTINAAGSDGRHQASEFYATGTGANSLPSGTTAQAPSGVQGLLRINKSTRKLTVVRTGTSYDDVLTAQDTMGASIGQVLRWNGTSWVPSNDYEVVSMVVAQPTSNFTSTGVVPDGAWRVPSTFNGWTLYGYTVSLYTAGSGSGSITIQVNRATPGGGSSSGCSMTFLAGDVQKDVVNCGLTLSTGDMLRLNVGTNDLATSAQGLVVTYILKP
ncbi:MAG: hypothetical protein LCH81_01115 [Bacteroidetes bacterium]|nr:hypothetical protein [Bacteroidota bacterium]